MRLLPADSQFEAKLAVMSDDDLAAVDLASLAPGEQDALLREVSRRARHEEGEASRRADITYWKRRGKLLRWALVAILAGVLSIAYGIMN